jgi:DNA-directed RNA polymerase subunit RPC12/RpoP
MSKVLPDVTESDDGPECPHCGRGFIPDEGYYYDQTKFDRFKCDECGRESTVEIFHVTTWRCKLC